MNPMNLQKLTRRHDGEGHAEAVQLVARQVAVDGLQVRPVLVLRLGQRVPDDVGHVFDQLPDDVRTRVRGRRVGQEVDIAVAFDHRLELLMQGLHQVPLHVGLDPQVGRGDILIDVRAVVT